MITTTTTSIITGTMITASRRALLRGAFAVVAAPLIHLPALAQGGAAAIAIDTSADRMPRLIAGAKTEGALTLYTSATNEDMGALAAAFEKKYGVKVRIWRASSENIVQRAATEARGNRFEADVFETDSGAMESLHREKLLQEVTSPALLDLSPAAIQPHREWIGTRYNVYAAAYNTRVSRKETLPKRYADLLQPLWKGRLGVEVDDGDWFGGVISELGEDKGLNLFRNIVAANGISVRKGHTLLANLVVSGEVPLALTTYA